MRCSAAVTTCTAAVRGPEAKSVHDNEVELDAQHLAPIHVEFDGDRAIILRYDIEYLHRRSPEERCPVIVDFRHRHGHLAVRKHLHRVRKAEVPRIGAARAQKVNAPKNRRHVRVVDLAERNRICPCRLVALAEQSRIRCRILNSRCSCVSVRRCGLFCGCILSTHTAVSLCLGGLVVSS